VDDIRQIIENIKYHTIKSKYKIYIIDEVHMLSGSAFNALLKTIEEPPANVIFILATTELHKIPLTVKSRCIHFAFRKVDPSVIYTLLEKILKDSDIKYDPESIGLIVREAEGSIRDSQTLLEQVISFSEDNITYQKTVDLLGIAGFSQISQCLLAVLQKNYDKILDIIEKVDRLGLDWTKFLSDLATLTRNLIILHSNKEALTDEGFSPDELSVMESMINHAPEDKLQTIFGKIIVAIDTLKFSHLQRFVIESSLLDCAKTESFVPISEIINELSTQVKSPYINTNNSNSNNTNSPHINTHTSIKTSANTNSPHINTSANPPHINTYNPQNQQASSLKKKLLNKENVIDFIKYITQHNPILSGSFQQGMCKIKENQLSIIFQPNAYSSQSITESPLKEELLDLFNQFFTPDCTLKIELLKKNEPAKEYKSLYDQQLEKQKQAMENKKKALINHPIVQKTVEALDANITQVILEKNDQI